MQKRIVLLPGWGLNSKIWAPLIPSLQKKYDVFAIDYPGFGKNYILECPNTVNGVLDWLDQSIPPKTFLIGWSLGGALALKYAIQHPNKVLGVITISTSLFFLKEQDWPGVFQLTFEKFKKGCRDPKKLLQQFIALINHPVKLSHNQSVQLQPTMKNLPSAVNLLITLEWLAKIDLRKALKRITCPVLPVFGAQDPLIPFSASQKVIDDLSQNVVILKNASHHPFLTHPDEIINLADHFIEQSA